MPIIAHLHALFTIICPAWCSLPAGHAPEHVDDVDGSALFVHHCEVLPDAGGHRITLTQSVDVDADGSVAAHPVRVVVDDQLDDAATVTDTRKFLAGLALAAAFVDGGAR